jgi:aspartokinase
LPNTYVYAESRSAAAVLRALRRRRVEVTMVPQPMFQAIAPNRLALSVEDKNEQQENRKARAPNRNDRLAYTSGIDTKGEIKIISIVNEKNSEAPLPMLS